MKRSTLLLIYGAVALTLFSVMIAATAFTPRYYDDEYYAQETEFYASFPTPTAIPVAQQVIVVQTIPAGTTIDATYLFSQWQRVGLIDKVVR
ncbi:MAG: hypothetical protein AAGK74_07000, partial [Chloroflexota bacterium]